MGERTPRQRRPSRAPGSPSHSRSMAIPRSQGSTSPGRLGSGEARLLPHLAGPEKVRAQGPRGAVRLSPCFQALQTLGFSGRRGMDLPACVFHVIPRDRNTGRWAPGATPSSSRQPTSTARCVEKLQTEPLPRGPQADRGRAAGATWILPPVRRPPSSAHVASLTPTGRDHSPHLLGNGMEGAEPRTRAATLWCEPREARERRRLGGSRGPSERPPPESAAAGAGHVASAAASGCAWSSGAGLRSALAR